MYPKLRLALKALTVILSIVLLSLLIYFIKPQPNPKQIALVTPIIQPATPSPTPSPTTEIVVTAIPLTPTPLIPEPTAAISSPLQVTEVIDVEGQFIEMYKNGDLDGTMKKTLDVDKIGVKFEGWSPDGQFMLLRVKTGERMVGRYILDGPNAGKMGIGLADLWLADARGVPLHLLAEKVEWTTWSPDNEHIAYIHRTLVNEVVIDELWVVKTDGSDNRKLVAPSTPPNWVDNETIMFSNPKDEHLKTININTLAVNPIIINGEVETYPSVAVYEISPDKKHLAFLIRGQPIWYVATLVNNQAKVFFEINNIRFYRFSWSPDSEYLIFTSECNESERLGIVGCRDLRLIQPKTQKIIQMENYHSSIAPVWSPDNHFFVFRNETRLFLMDVTTRKAYLLYVFPKDANTNALGTEWSPNGEWIGINPKHSKAMLLKIQAVNKEQLKIIPNKNKVTAIKYTNLSPLPQSVKYSTKSSASICVDRPTSNRSTPPNTVIVHIESYYPEWGATDPITRTFTLDEYTIGVMIGELGSTPLPFLPSNNNVWEQTMLQSMAVSIRTFTWFRLNYAGQFDAQGADPHTITLDGYTEQWCGFWDFKVENDRQINAQVFRPRIKGFPIEVRQKYSDTVLYQVPNIYLVQGNGTEPIDAEYRSTVGLWSTDGNKPYLPPILDLISAGDTAPTNASGFAQWGSQRWSMGLNDNRKAFIRWTSFAQHLFHYYPNTNLRYINGDLLPLPTSERFNIYQVNGLPTNHWLREGRTYNLEVILQVTDPEGWMVNTAALSTLFKPPYCRFSLSL